MCLSVLLLISCQYPAPFDREMEAPEILKIQQVEPVSPHFNEVAEDSRGLGDVEYLPVSGTIYDAQHGYAKKMTQTEGKGEGKYSLSFDNADIGEVAKAILGDSLKSNYVINPKVTGRISLQTTAPLSDAEMISVLETLLRMNGATLIKSDSLYRIEADTTAIVNAPSRGTAQTGKILPGFQVQVVPLRFAGAQEMQKILEPLLPPKSVIYADPLRNLLLVAANADDLENVKQTVSAFDVDFMRGMAVAFFPLHHVDPVTLKHELDALMMSGDKGAAQGLLRILPVERLNAVMAVSAQPASLRDVETWVERLDRLSPHKFGDMNIYKAQHVDAVSLARTLTQVFGPATPSRSGLRASSAPGMSSASAGGGASGARDNGLSSQASSVSSGGSGSTAVSPSAGGASVGVNEALSGPGFASTAYGVFGTGASTVGVSSGNGDRQAMVAELANNARVVADPANNALVIFAKPAEYHDMETVLKELDTMPREVIVDAMIAEVTLTGSLQYGLQWYFNHGSSSGGLGLPGLLGVNANDPLSAVPANAATKGFFTPSMAAGGFSYVMAANELRVELDLLASQGKVTILSMPSIMVRNNQEGQINVGQQVAVSNGSQVVTTDGVPASTSTFSYRDSGVTLKLRPRVNEGGLVFMTVQQELVQPQAASAAAPLNPPFLQRKVLSTVAVHSGDTLAMGGLISEQNNETVYGIPILSELPYIGWLFGTTLKALNRTEVVMLLTPRIIASRTDAVGVANEYRRRLSEWNETAPLRPAAVH